MVPEFNVDTFQCSDGKELIDKKVLTLKTLYLGTPCLFAALRPYNVMQRCSKCMGNKRKRRN